jgi:hypothetical protein
VLDVDTGRARWPSLLRGDKSWGIESVMAGAEQRGLPYLFRLRLIAHQLFLLRVH